MECFLKNAGNFRKFPEKGKIGTAKRRCRGIVQRSGGQILSQNIALQWFAKQSCQHKGNEGVGQHVGAVVDQGIGGGRGEGPLHELRGSQNLINCDAADVVEIGRASCRERV